MIPTYDSFSTPRSPLPIYPNFRLRRSLGTALGNNIRGDGAEVKALARGDAQNGLARELLGRNFGAFRFDSDVRVSCSFVLQNPHQPPGYSHRHQSLESTRLGS